MGEGSGPGTKRKRRAAQALVTTYHEAELAGLIEHVAEALERYRAGEFDPVEVDEVIHRYTKAARELWKFCFAGGSGAHLEAVARTLERRVASSDRPDWWEATERRGG